MVCVINEAFAKRFFEGRNPIGLHVTQIYADQRHTYEIVGIVRDSRQRGLRDPIEHRFYTPVTQPAAMIGGVTFIVRPNGVPRQRSPMSGACSSRRSRRCRSCARDR